jgi:hypothetical protein
MADTVSTGSSTSEFSLTKLVLVVGTLVTAIGTTLAVLPTVGVSGHWVGVALAGLAMVSKVLALLGYQNARTSLKQSELAAASARGAAAATAVTTASEAVDVIKGALAK